VETNWYLYKVGEGERQERQEVTEAITVVVEVEHITNIHAPFQHLEQQKRLLSAQVAQQKPCQTLRVRVEATPHSALGSHSLAVEHPTTLVVVVAAG